MPELTDRDVALMLLGALEVTAQPPYEAGIRLVVENARAHLFPIPVKAVRP